MSNQEIVATGVVAGGVTTLMIISLVLWIMLIVARWKIFTKANEAGWKSIIPVYSDYVQWRIGWKKTGMFWLVLILAIAAYVLAAAGGLITVNAAGRLVAAAAPNPIILFLVAACMVVAIVLNLMALYKLMVSFGHGAGWFVLSIFIPRIMLLVLGFGSSTYSGSQD
ncbi:MAG: hypothetical protein IJ087_22985 [Eggerthellaceae bacterium]|nr:hypothetical protein [Eggerthellaceae bacterium]